MVFIRLQCLLTMNIVEYLWDECACAFLHKNKCWVHVGFWRIDLILYTFSNIFSLYLATLKTPANMYFGKNSRSVFSPFYCPNIIRQCFLEMKIKPGNMAQKIKPLSKTQTVEARTNSHESSCDYQLSHMLNSICMHIHTYTHI